MPSRSALLVSLLVCACFVQTQTISTVAGGLIVDNKPALATPLASPGGVAVDANGNVFVLDTGNSVIRRVDVNTGIEKIVAGGGTQFNDTVPIPGLSAYIPRPVFGIFDSSGNLLFSDGTYRVRKLTPAGMVTTAAGNGNNGYYNDGFPATSAELGPPLGLTLDASGNLYIADCYNSAVRKVDASTGVISTVVGGNGFGFGGDGAPATKAVLNCPSSMDFDANGNMFIVDANNNRIRRVDATTGVITTIAGNGLAALSSGVTPATPRTVGFAV